MIQEIHHLLRANAPSIPSTTEPGAFWEDLPSVLPNIGNWDPTASQDLPIGEFGSETRFPLLSSSSKFFGLDPTQFGVVADLGIPSSSQSQEFASENSVPSLGLSTNLANLPVKTEKEEISLKRENSGGINPSLQMKREGSGSLFPSSGMRASEVLTALMSLHDLQEDQLNTIYHTLKNVDITDQDAFSSLQQELFKFQNTIKSEIREVGEL
jgi:hypothetical protein